MGIFVKNDKHVQFKECTKALAGKKKLENKVIFS